VKKRRGGVNRCKISTESQLSKIKYNTPKNISPALSRENAQKSPVTSQHDTGSEKGGKQNKRINVHQSST